MRAIRPYLLALCLQPLYAATQCRGLTECGCTVVSGCGNVGCTELYGRGIGNDGPAKTLINCTNNVARMHLRFDGDVVSHYMVDAFTHLDQLRHLYIGDLGSIYRTASFPKLAWVEEVFIFGDGSKAVMSEQLNDGDGNYYAHQMTTPGSPIVIEGTVPNEDGMTWYNTLKPDQVQPVPTPAPPIEGPVSVAYMATYADNQCSTDYNLTKSYVGQCTKHYLGSSFKVTSATVLRGEMYRFITYATNDCTGVGEVHFKNVGTRSCVTSTQDPSNSYMIRTTSHDFTAPAVDFDCADRSVDGVWACDVAGSPTMYPTTSPTTNPTHVPTPAPTASPTHG